MDQKEFGLFRQRFQKTQKEMANLLGVSLKAVQSFEQGWRKIPVYIERQLLFLLSTKQRVSGKSRPCWDIRNCSSANREACPAWEFNMGRLCWFINGTICQGKVQGSWAKKIRMCQNCEVFVQTMPPKILDLEGGSIPDEGAKAREEEMVEPTAMGYTPPERILSKEEIIAYLEEKDPDQVIQLYREADRVREDFMGDEVHIRGLIEFSNYCERDCLYCGLRKSNNQLLRYRMTLEEIFLAAQVAQGLNFKTVVLQSGEDPFYSVEDICSLVRRIKTNLNLAITLCIGERSFEDYECFRKAGADRYLLKFETSNPSLFRRLKPDTSYEHRLRCLDWLRQLGYQVGSGNMVGLPGQTLENMAEDILAFEKLDLDMIGIGPFIPHPNTHLRDARKEELDTVLKVVALTRIVTRNTHIPATTAVGTLYPDERRKALQCGANVIMPHATPRAYRQLYQIYPNKICIDESPQNCRHCIEGMVISLGRRIGDHFGHTMKSTKALGEED